HHRRPRLQLLVGAVRVAQVHVEGLQQLPVLVLRADDLDLVVHLLAEQLEDLVGNRLGRGHHLAEVEHRLHQRSRVGVDLLGEVGQRSTTAQAHGLAVAARQANTAHRRRLHVLHVLLALLPLRLAAPLGRTARPPEGTGSAATSRTATATRTSAETATGAAAETAATTRTATAAGTAATAGSTAARRARRHHARVRARRHHARVRTRSAFPGTTSGARALATALLALLATRTLATALLAGPRRPLLRGTAAHAEWVVADPRRTRTRPGRLGLGRDNTGLAGAAARLGPRLRAGLGDRLGTGLGSFGSRRRLSRLARRLRTRLRSWFRARLRTGLGSLRRRRFGLRARLGASLGALGRLSAVAILALRRLGECVTQSARHRGLHGGGRRLDVLALLGELVQYF